jgi:hypothetical protein
VDERAPALSRERGSCAGRAGSRRLDWGARAFDWFRDNINGSVEPLLSKETGRSADID